MDFVQRIDNSFISSHLFSSFLLSSRLFRNLSAVRTLELPSSHHHYHQCFFAVVGAAQSLQPVHGAVVVETETLVIVAVEVFTTVAVDTAVEVSVAVTVSVA